MKRARTVSHEGVSRQSRTTVAPCRPSLPVPSLFVQHSLCKLAVVATATGLQASITEKAGVQGEVDLLGRNACSGHGLRVDKRSSPSSGFQKESMVFSSYLGSLGKEEEGSVRMTPGSKEKGGSGGDGSYFHAERIVAGRGPLEVF